MHVLLMSSSSGSLGGGEQYLVKLGAGLAAEGLKITTAMSAHSRMDGLDQACTSFGKVVRVRYCNTYDRVLRSGGAVLARATIARMKRLFQDIKPDLLHVNKQNVEDGLDLMVAARRSGLPTVATIHIARSMTELRSRGGWLRDWLASNVLRRSRAHFITVAHHCGQQLASACPGLQPNQVHAVWNGVESAPAADRQAIRADWGCSPAHLVVGCVARLEQQKDPLFALELIRQLPENVKLVWVGDGRLREEFERKIQRDGLGARVHLEGWRTDARQRLAGFDVFLLPSEYEGFPFAVLEAMAAGLPCVASDVDGTREAVVEGTTGFLCKSRDLNQWLSTLRALVNDSALRDRLGRHGLERMRRHFSLEAMARETIRVYETAISSGEQACP